MFTVIQNTGYLLEQLKRYPVNTKFFTYGNNELMNSDLENLPTIKEYTDAMDLENNSMAINAVIYILHNLLEAIEEISRNTEENRLIINYKKSERSRVAKYHEINESAKYIALMDRENANRLKMHARLFEPFISKPDQSVKLYALLNRAQKYLNDPVFSKVYTDALTLVDPMALQKFEKDKEVIKAGAELHKQLNRYAVSVNQLKIAGSIKIFLLLSEMLDIAKTPLAVWVDDLYKQLGFINRVNIKKDAVFKANVIGRYELFYLYGYDNAENKQVIWGFNHTAHAIDGLVKDIYAMLRELNFPEEAETFRQRYKEHYYEAYVASLIH